MNINRTNIDALNAILKVDITADDYQQEVDKILKKYQSTAVESGFRKGKVPMGHIKKKYGKTVLFKEVNKILQNSVNKYIIDEKIDILGHPIPVPKDDIDWNSKQFSFEFELGLVPSFEVELPNKNKITKYKITCTDENIEEYITNVRKSYGTLVQKDEIKEEYNVKGTFIEIENGIEKENGIKHTTTFKVDTLKQVKNKKIFLTAKIGDSIKLKSENLFNKPEQLATNLNKTTEEVKDLNIEFLFTIEEINHTELADLNQELFDKVYPNANITSEPQFKDKVKEEMEKMYIKEADKHFSREIQEFLLEETNFDLPKKFLKKWLAQNTKETLTPDQAEEEFSKAEKGLKYQLIESKLAKENNLEVSLDDIKAFAKETISVQMLQFGQQPDSKTIEQITQGILQNQDEVKRISEQIMNQKVMEICKEKMNLSEKEITAHEFIKLLSKK